MRYSLVFVTLFVILLVIKSAQFSQYGGFKEGFSDLYTHSQEKNLNRKILIIGIDEKSIDRFGRWPWERSILAKGIKNLQNAEVVGFDMVFSEPTSHDAQLAAAIENLENSVCGFFLRKKATAPADEEQLAILADSSLDLLQSKLQDDTHFLSANAVELNDLALLQSCTMQGAFSTLLSEDKLYRDYPVAFFYGDTLYPSLGTQMLRLYLNEDLDYIDKRTLKLGKEKLYLDDHGFVRLNFYDKEEYKVISFLDVYDGKIPKELLKNRLVLLGITEMGVGDVVSTPIGSLYGVFLHATFLSNFLNDEFIVSFYWIDTLVLFIILFLLYSILYVKSIFKRFALYVVVYFGMYEISLLAFNIYSIQIDMLTPLIGTVLTVMIQESWLFYDKEKDARFIKKAFSNYLSNELLTLLVKNNKKLQLGGEKKELSILFSDIRNFTNLSEKMHDPQQLIALLNRYFTPMTQAVLNNRGMVDKYIGDAVMAFFNAPVAIDNHAQAACDCALEMIEKLKKLNMELEAEGMKPIHIGIGINTGEAVVGNMGSSKRFNYTVIGDSVNLASRLEAKTKEYGVNIIISQTTYEQVKDTFECRDLGVTQIKGKEKVVHIYELVAKKF